MNESIIKVLFIDTNTGFYKMQRYSLGDFFGPVDLGLHLAGKYNSLNIGTGMFAGSIIPGSNRLFFTGFSPCWGGFYVSSMGGAGLVFDDLGVNMVALVGKANTPSVLYLNRIHGEEIQVEIKPIPVEQIWKEGRKGIYSLMDYTYEHYKDKYENEPRILVVGPAAQKTDFGAIASAPIKNKQITYVDTWAGRGGFGTKMLQSHGIASIIYGGTFIDEDFRDRNVADTWFENKYNKKLAAKDLEATTKYRFDPKFDTGGTFGVNYAGMEGNLMAFNYKTIYLSEQERREIHEKYVLGHYLKQFNEETIKTKQQKTCGEPCAAVCKKLYNEYKKDYEPYQVMGPLCGIFDQRAAEKLNHHADSLGFDAISVGGVLSWLMQCIDEGLLAPEESGTSLKPKFNHTNFDLILDSEHNAKLGIELLDAIIEKRGMINLTEGARKFARKLSRIKGKKVMEKFMYNAFARKGWMVPNQYWTPGVLSPMAIMGKYYMNYGKEFIPPRKLGQINAERMFKEMVIDNTGICRFHRAWAEDMVPDIIENLFGLKDKFLKNIKETCIRINSRNASIFWESELCYDFVYTFLKKQRDIQGNHSPELIDWINRFEKNKKEAAFDFWYEIHKGIHESFME